MIGDHRIPAINPMFRFQWEPAQQAHVLLYPEGMVRLNPSAGEILTFCDGFHTVGMIISRLQRKFPDAGDLSGDIQEFLGEAREKQWIRLN